MDMNNLEWQAESEWLENILQEIRKQLEEKRSFNEKFRKEAIETQRELWQEVGSISIANELDQLVDFMSYVDVLKSQKRNHEFTRQQKEKYERMLLSPYFGRIDFLENGDSKADIYYIGVSNLVNEDYDILIYDWRAPVSSMYYDYEMGEASYQCPEGIIHGNISLKRQYKINDDKIEYMFDSNLNIDDEMLQEILGSSTDSKMKSIVTTIQREQNKVIRNEEYQNMIVQGPAGSGKTSVALHRVAYLLYKHRDSITPQNIVIFSPNDIFNDYISNVLPQLEEDNMHQTTFKEYMHQALGDEFKKEDYYEMMEYILSSKEKVSYQQRIMNIQYKTSIEFIDVLKRYILYVEKADRNFSDIIFRGNCIVSAQELEMLFFYDYCDLPLKRRLKKLRERVLFLLKPYEEQRMNEIVSELYDSGSYLDPLEIRKKSRGLVREETQEIRNEINRITTFNLGEICKELFEKLELFTENLKDENEKKKMEEIKRYTLENLQSKTLYYEDQISLLYLMGIFGELPKTSDIKYVIIDEAQDYTPLQYEIFHQLFGHARITMLGDLNQSIHPFMNVGSYDNIAHIFTKESTCVINLTKSYRSTMDITEFSSMLLNEEMRSESVARYGEKPLVLGFQDEEAIKERVIEDIKECKDRGYQSIAIITRTKKEANEVYHSLKGKIQVELIVKEDDEYINDIVIIPAYLAKGLEFDVVLIYNAGNENYNCEEERQLLYTACTRALHILRIYYSNQCTPLLQGEYSY